MVCIFDFSHKAIYHWSHRLATQLDSQRNSIWWNGNLSNLGRLHWWSGAARLDGLPGCSPPWKMLGKRFCQTAKLALSLDIVTKISQHNHFRYFRRLSAQRFLEIQQNQCFAACQRHHLCDDVFSTLANEFGDFGAVIRTALKERNQTIGCKKHGGISAYRKAFLIFWRLIFKEKTEEIWPWLFFTTWISLILNFIIKFNNVFASTLAILAALDSNLVANLGLRKYRPSFICTSSACNCRLSWWAF